MYDEDLKEVIDTEYFHSHVGNSGHLATEKNYRIRYGDFYLKESHFKDLCISNCTFNINRDIKLLGKTNGEILCLTFMKKGESFFEYGNKNASRLKQNTFNLFCLSGDVRSVLSLKKGQKNEGMDILFSKEYFLNLVDKFPQIFETLHKRYQVCQNFALYKEGMYFYHEIQQIIEQIAEADVLGNCASLFSEAKILELFANLLKKGPDKQKDCIPGNIKDKIIGAKCILEDRHLSPPSIHELAIETGMCDTALKHYFKRIFDKTIYGYLFEFRMNKATNLLKQKPDLNITEIAEQTGYEHQAHFCTAFKRKFGVTPKEFRQQCEILQSRHLPYHK
jgi:AraC-like DNA-binding protein